MVRVVFRPLVLRVFLGMTPLRSHHAAARARAVATQNCQSWRGKVMEDDGERQIYSARAKCIFLRAWLTQ